MKSFLLERTVKKAVLSVLAAHTRSCGEWWAFVVAILALLGTSGALVVLSELTGVHLIGLKLALGCSRTRGTWRSDLFWFEVRIGHACSRSASCRIAQSKSGDVYRAGR